MVPVGSPYHLQPNRAALKYTITVGSSHATVFVSEPEDDPTGPFYDLVGRLHLEPSEYISWPDGEKRAWKVARSKVNQPGHGIGLTMYLYAAQVLGIIHPDWQWYVTPSAARLWSRLWRYPTPSGHRVFMLSPGTFPPLIEKEEDARRYLLDLTQYENEVRVLQPDVEIGVDGSFTPLMVESVCSILLREDGQPDYQGWLVDGEYEASFITH